MLSNAVSFGCHPIAKAVSRVPTHMSDLNTSDNCWGTKTMPYTQTNCQVCTLETVGESTVACTVVGISCLGQSHLSNSFNFNLINSWDSQYVYCVYVPPPKPDKFPCRKKNSWRMMMMTMMVSKWQFFVLIQKWLLEACFSLCPVEMFFRINTVKGLWLCWFSVANKNKK